MTEGGHTDSKTFKVGELARQTGVSVRTLHYYEELGLLSPTRRTAAGYRLYGPGDMARLQQILSLRQLGFSLEEICGCLSDPAFSPGPVIRAQVERLRVAIAHQEQLCERLERIAEGLETGRSATVDDLLQAMEAMTMMDRYYTPQQLTALQQRGRDLGAEAIRQAESDWTDLLSEVRAAMREEAAPTSPRVRALAARWQALLQAFTGGDEGIQVSLQAMWSQEKEIAGVDTAEMRAMGQFLFTP